MCPMHLLMNLKKKKKNSRYELRAVINIYNFFSSFLPFPFDIFFVHIVHQFQRYGCCFFFNFTNSYLTMMSALFCCCYCCSFYIISLIFLLSFSFSFVHEIYSGNFRKHFLKLLATYILYSSET